MTDRELLELAAKAVLSPSWYGNDAYLCGFLSRWNPLADDGDALRLAINLGIDLLFTPEDVEAVATQYAYEDNQEMISPWACESWTLKPQDPSAATRRAIVRAAAEVGKQMGDRL